MHQDAPAPPRAAAFPTGASRRRRKPMKWKLWGKTPSPPEATEAPAWPTDAYTSVKFFVGLFVKSGSLPFREWKSPLATVRPELQLTVEIAVHALQMRLYFWLFERHFGTLEAEIAEGAFLELLTQLSDDPKSDAGRMTQFLLGMIDSAFELAKEQGEKTITTTDGEVAVPPEYFMALYILLRMPDSPYYNSEGDPLWEGSRNAKEGPERAVCTERRARSPSHYLAGRRCSKIDSSRPCQACIIVGGSPDQELKSGSSALSEVSPYATRKPCPAFPRRIVLRGMLSASI